MVMIHTQWSFSPLMLCILFFLSQELSEHAKWENDEGNMK